MSGFLNDLRSVPRLLARSPGLAAAAVMTLALGVGANATAFSWVRGVLLDAVPGASNPASLRVVVARTRAGEPARLSVLDYRDLARRTDVLEGMLAQQWTSVALGAPGGPHATNAAGAIVSDDYFRVLDVRPVLGRGFRPGEDRDPGAAVAVIGHALWERAFDADPAAIGRTVTLNGAPFTVIGVAPRGFYGSFLSIGVDLFVPLSQVARFDPAGDRTKDRADRWLLPLARLRAGVSTAAARGALTAEMRRIDRDYPGLHDGYGIDVTSLAGSPWGAPAELGPIVLALAGLAALVLLAACANVANLLLGRALARRREIALRTALGASRWQIARLLVAESVALALLAGAAAAASTAWTSRLLLAFLPPTGFPIRMTLGLDASVVGVAFGAALLAALLFGLLPGLHAARGTIAADLGSSSVSVAGPRDAGRLRRALVAAQVALSLVLLAAGGLFARSLAASRRIDPGFETRRLLLVGVKLFPAGYDENRGRAYLDRLVEETRALPDVRDVALARRAPLGFGGFPAADARVEGYATPPGEEMRVRYNAISPGYFETVRTRLVGGREFVSTDRADAEPAAIVNQAFADRYFAGRDALGGRVFALGVWRRVVGVARDSKYEKLDEPHRPFLFVPLAQSPSDEVVLHARTDGDPALAAPRVAELMRRLDPNLPAFEVQTIAEHLGEELFGQRLGTALLAVVGLLVLAIAGLGLYALAAYDVAERRREIGVRLALGAAPARLVAGILARGMRLVGVGAAFGLAAAALVGLLLRGELTGISPLDPAALAGAGLLVAAIAGLATYLAARRAALLEPVAALRSV